MKVSTLIAAALLLVFSLSPSCRDGGGNAKKENGEASAGMGKSTVPAPDPEAGGLRAEPPGGDLGEMEFVRISFPEEMVDQSEIGKEVRSPVEVKPAAISRFRWTSTRSGILETYKQGEMDLMRRITMIPGLEDLSGKAVDARGWGAEFAKADLEVLLVRFLDPADDLVAPDPQLPLACKQRVLMSFSRDVLPAEISRNIAFVDSETKQRHAVRVALDQEQADEPQGTVIFEPAEALPEGRTYWLVLERTGDYSGTHPLPHLRVFPAGRTSPLEFTWARGYNQPRDGKFLRLGFNKNIDLSSLKPDDIAIAIDPPVKAVRLDTEKRILVVHADFKTGVPYHVTLPSGILATDGSKLVEKKELDLEVPQRRPAIVLDSKRYSESSGDFDLGLELCRTKSISWQISAVTRERYGKISERLKEFGDFSRNDDGEFILDPRDETVRYVETDFLIPSMDLPVLAKGEMEGEAEEELAPRKVRWPDACGEPGMYLIEFHGTDTDGREIGNRCLVEIQPWFVRNYASGTESFLHVSEMSGGAPVAAAKVYVYPWEDGPPTEFVTNADGFVSYGQTGAKHVFVEKDGVSVFHDLSDPTSASVSSEGELVLPTGVIFTDGDLYRPGEIVRFSGTLRTMGEDGKLVIPAGDATLTVWNDQAGGDLGLFPPGDEPNLMRVPIDEAGMISGGFPLPEGALSGKYTLRLDLGNGEAMKTGEAEFVVAEFRKPDVFVELGAPDTVGDVAEVSVSSSYFHGAPQSGAKVAWRAQWLSSDWMDDLDDEENPWSYFSFGDEFSPQASSQGLEGILASLRAKASGLYESEARAVPVTAVDRGEGVLDKDGILKIRSECPFGKDSRSHRAQVFWVIEVQGETGEINRAVTTQHIQYADRILALRARNEEEGMISIRSAALTIADVNGDSFPVDIEVLSRDIKVSREAIGERLVRYRNTPVFKSVFKKTISANDTLDLPVPVGGDYVIVGTPQDMPGAPVVSCQVTGVYGESDGPVLDDFNAEAIPAKPDFNVGEDASVQVRVPFAGWAQVTVETDHILDTLPPVRLKGTADSITIPVKAEYFPNCFVRIHVQGEGEDGGRPLERRAICELKVRNPNIELKVRPSLETETVRPREEVRGSVLVSALGRPLAGAKVVVGVIDESLLSLGKWKIPDPIAAFYPERPHVFDSARALDSSWYEFTRPHLGQTQKGFIVGGGGIGSIPEGPVLRENENPRPLWQTEGVTGADGKISFAFKAPDSLTGYRVFAYAVSGSESAGRGATKLRVTQTLRLKPFLPLFVREDDRVELRCRVELDASAGYSLDAAFIAEAGNGIILSDEKNRSVKLEPGQSTVVSIPARIDQATAGTDAELTFSITGNDGLSDAVRVTIPVKSAYVARTEHRVGSISENETLSADSVLEGVSTGTGTDCDLLLSGTRWMPKLVSLSSAGNDTPTVADQGAAALGAVLMASMDGFLPDSLSRRETALQDFQQTMVVLDRSVIADADFGWLPRWSGGTEPDGATTAIVAMALDLMEEEGMNLPVPDVLADALDGWRRIMLEESPRIFSGAAPTDFERCVALAMEARERRRVAPARLKALVRYAYDHREKLDLESKCFLALADSLLKARESESVSTLSDEESQKLLSEIEKEEAPLTFNPETLGSRMRAEAIRLYVVSRLSQGMADASRQEIVALLKPVLDGSLDLNAQENLWVLLAARSAIGIEDPAILTDRVTTDPAPEISPNEVTLAWLGHPAAELREMLSEPMKPGVESQWMLSVTRHDPVGEALSSDALKLTRHLTNLTDPSRTGTSESPLRIGDYVLLDYAMETGGDTYQLALEENLPAALETVNPDLPSVKATFPAAPIGDADVIGLSHVNRRSDKVSLYFGHLSPGTSRYAILTRVVGAGEFHWPAAGAEPMYDKRVRATTVDTVIHSSAE